LAGTTGSYFVNGQTGSIFYGTSNKYVIVDVDDEEVLLQSKGNYNKYLIYINEFLFLTKSLKRIII